MTDDDRDPPTWTRVPLVEIAEIVMGQSPPGSTYNSDGDGLPFFQGKADFGLLHPVPRKWCSAPKKVAEVDDILISVRAPVGPTNLADERAAIGRGLAAIRPRAGISSRYVLYAIRASEDELRRQAVGSTFEAISGSVLRAHVVPLPPWDEQLAVVAAIEANLSRIDAAAHSLRRSRALVGAYRQSLLSALLQRSRTWREVPVTEVVRPVKHSMAIGPFGSDLKVSDYREAGVPLVFVRNVRASRFGDPGTRFVSPEKAAELASHRVIAGDVLVTKMGDPPGDAVLYPEGQQPAIITADVIKVTPDLSVCIPEFLVLALNSPAVRAHVLRITQGVAQKKVSLARYKTVRIPLPPLPEQRRIAADAEVALSAVAVVEREINGALERGQSLRKAILQRALSGSLPSGWRLGDRT